MKKVYASSEFWVGLAVIVGQIVVALGFVPMETWDKVLYPALVYIIARITGKLAKTVNKVEGQ